MKFSKADVSQERQADLCGDLGHGCGGLFAVNRVPVDVLLCGWVRLFFPLEKMVAS